MGSARGQRLHQKWKSAQQASRKNRVFASNRFRPVLEELECRMTPATFLVNTTLDTNAVNLVTGQDANGNISLRSALEASNNTPGGNIIDFAIEAPGSLQYIQPVAAALPTITQPVTIDGWSQGGPGYTGSPLIDLNGFEVDTQTGVDGLTIAANNVTVRGLAINGFEDFGGSGGNGITLLGASHVQIYGNYIGTNASGTFGQGNAQNGIFIDAQSTNNIIGGFDGLTNAAHSNVISGNFGSGVEIDGSGNTIVGNYIGVGGDGFSVISNISAGISITGSHNTIGTIADGAGNIIARNGFQDTGVAVFSGTGNAIRGNSMFRNSGLGIDLADDGTTPNDTGDADTGPNNLQNFPEIQSIAAGGSEVIVSVSVPSALANSHYPLALDFYLADNFYQSEGETYLGTVTYTAAEAGQVEQYVFEPLVPVSAQDLIVATATDSAGNTSEFSVGCFVQQLATPQLVNVSITPAISTGSSATLTGDMVSPNADAAQTLIVDWGDGSTPQTFDFAAGATSFSETHQYLHAGAYAVQLTYLAGPQPVLNFDDFTDTSSLVVSGNADGVTTNDGNVLRLVSANIGQVGAAFDTSAVDTNRAFSTQFAFRISNAGGASDGTDVGGDGFTFTLQTGTTGSDQGGGGLGYGGISPSVAVEFDTYQNAPSGDVSSNALGIDIDGSMVSVTSVDVPGMKFDNGQLYYSWIVFDGNTLQVYLNTTDVCPEAPLLSYYINIAQVLGQNAAFAGFTAATGLAFESVDILSWQLNYPTATDSVQTQVTDHPVAAFSNNGPIAEGSPAFVTFSGATEPGRQQPNDPYGDQLPTFTYSYDFNHDGVFDIVNSSSPSVIVPPQFLVPGMNAVTGRITDQFGESTDYTTIILVRNVAPVLAVPDHIGIGVHDVFTIRGSFSDPGTGPWRLQVDFHNGLGPVDIPYAANHTFQVTGSYPVEGNFPITFIVDDGHGGTAIETTIVYVLPATPLGPPSVAYTKGGTATANIPGQVTATLIEPGVLNTPAAIIVSVLPNPVGLGSPATPAVITVDPNSQTILKTYDVRVVGASPNAIVVVTYDVDSPVGVVPSLWYIDPLTGARLAVEGSARPALQPSYIRRQTSPTHYQFTVIFDSTSQPTVAGLFATVFTFTGPQNGPTSVPTVANVGPTSLVSNTAQLPAPAIPTTSFLGSSDSRLSVSSSSSLAASVGAGSSDDQQNETVSRVLQWMNDIHRASWGTTGTPRSTTSETPENQSNEPAVDGTKTTPENKKTDPPGSGLATPPAMNQDEAAAPHALEEFFAGMGRGEESLAPWLDPAARLAENVPTEQDRLGVVAESGIPTPPPGEDRLGLLCAAVPLALGGLTPPHRDPAPRRRKKPRPR